MSAAVSIVKLHLTRKSSTFVVPILIILTVAAISVLISLIFWRAGSIPGSDAWVESSRSNPGIFYAFPGFLGYLGIATVATTFPFALTLGATRRAFVVGTLIWNAITAAYIAAILAVLNLIEIATHHWFVGFYIFDVYILGAGNTGKLLLIVFLGVLAVLTIGEVFASAWVRFGAPGPQILAVGVILAVGIVALIIVPQATEIGAAFQSWWLAIAAGGAIALSASGTWLLLRPAVVR
jgi:hypothetical protein